MKRTNAILTTAFFLTATYVNVMYVQAQISPNATPTGSAPTASPSMSPSMSPSASPSGSPSPNALMSTLNQDVLLNTIHYINQSEIVEANEALQTSINQEVRNYAQKMINDHQQSEQQVLQLSAQKNLPLYVYQPSTVDLATAAQLSNLTGSNYDQAYLNVQLEEHKKALNDLKSIQDQVTDPDLKKLVDQTTKTIQQHIDLANSSISALSTGATSSPVPSESPVV